jgi:hypothetical protein
VLQLNRFFFTTIGAATAYDLRWAISLQEFQISTWDFVTTVGTDIRVQFYVTSKNVVGEICGILREELNMATTCMNKRCKK